MFRSLTTRAPGRGYEKLSEEESAAEHITFAAKLDRARSLTFAAKLDRARSLPAKFFGGGGSGKSLNPRHEEKKLEKADAKQLKKASKIHPVFNFVDKKLRKKATANPEVSRYLQYLKEGGGKLYTIRETSSGTIIS